METWTEFVLARYNYWIVIVLMMVGLYTVFARGNLVKKIVGLNIFQTSVFIFYITIGKIAGGTAPIYYGPDLKKSGDYHGEKGGEKEAEGAKGLEGVADHAEAGLHDKIGNDLGANSLKDAVADLNGPAGSDSSQHTLPDLPANDIGKLSNDALIDAGKEAGAPAFDVASSAPDGAAIGDALSQGEIIYTNPLPHVLILTAIVVGVAGTAVGLALAVRIREAYGTIEEDELEAIDNVAEFGDDAPKAAGAA